MKNNQQQNQDKYVDGIYFVANSANKSLHSDIFVVALQTQQTNHFPVTTLPMRRNLRRSWFVAWAISHAAGLFDSSDKRSHLRPSPGHHPSCCLRGWLCVGSLSKLADRWHLFSRMGTQGTPKPQRLLTIPLCVEVSTYHLKCVFMSCFTLFECCTSNKVGFVT